MSEPQYQSAWAVCHDVSGIMIFTVRQTRREAISAFMAIAEGPGTEKLFRRYKRDGWRASHVSIQEHLFKPATRPTE